MIFARRTIQRFIDQLSDDIPENDLARLVQKLNRGDRASLDFEWEVAVLSAFQQTGDIAYESAHGGSTRPDLTFRSSGSQEVSFVADIAAVSDRGLEEENPTRLFSDLLHKKAKALGLKGGFHWNIRGKPTGPRFRDRKVKLAMPTRKLLPRFIESHVVPALKKIRDKRLTEARIPIEEGPYRMVIAYGRDFTTSGGGHLSYTVAYSLTRNPVHATLKRKAQLLRDSGFRGCKGIILCDGNCDLLKKRTRGVGDYNLQQIVVAFFRDNSSISFVVTMSVEYTRSVFSASGRRQVVAGIFANPNARYPVSKPIEEILHKLPSLLPTPVNDALNASYRVEEGRYGIGASRFGAYSVSLGSNSGSIRISARALLNLLAGRVDQQRFDEMHGFSNGETNQGIRNPFETALRTGLLIKQVSVEVQPDDDDDWITFGLKGPDVAVSPFRSEPKSSPG